jgi:peptidoglycan/xylan/chitin deacetylase (PgdA/CDA1 family)
VAAGHRIGNHSATHPAFAGLAPPLIRHQVQGATQSIETVTDADPRPLFRFPFGSKDARALDEVNALGYVAVRWTVDSLGWQGTMNGTRKADFTAARVLAAATPGEIVLMHVGSHPTDHSMLDAEALPTVIAGLRQRGYSFTTLRALLG